MEFYIWTVILLLLGDVTHVVKKVVERRKTDDKFSLKDYLTKYPYKTFLVVMAGAAGYLGLLSINELTYVSAFMTGYVADSLGGAAET